eukprot:SAG11_NODE_3033_length_2749_cov_4.883774_4_plen_159_part_00
MNMYRTDMRADCPPATTCQCDAVRKAAVPPAARANCACKATLMYAHSKVGGRVCLSVQLGEGGAAALVVEPIDDGGDVGIAITYNNNNYYTSYLGWVKPVLRLICDPGATSSAYTSTSGISTNPFVENAAGCTSEFDATLRPYHMPPSPYATHSAHID